MSALQSLGSLIDAFRPADGPPPQRLGAFMRWSLAGSWPMLIVAGILSSLAGVTEVVSALILGWVIDAAVNSGPTDFFAAHWSLVVWFLVFYLILRPRTFQVIIGLSLISYAVNLFILAMGRLRMDAAPILAGANANPADYVDPVPQALVLTAIVIGFAMTALFLVVLLAARGLTGNDHVDGKLD